MSRSARLLLLACATSLACSFAPTAALAHGRQPSLGQIAFDPDDANHVVVRGTWAFLTTHDDAASFTWTCAHAIDYDRTIEDPRIAVMASGRVLAAVFDGLSRSDPSGCRYDLATAPELAQRLVIDVANDPFDPRAVWIATSPGDRPNTILHSTDEGDTIEVRGSFEVGTLLERVVPSPSDPMRVYASGITLSPRVGYVWSSTDGARTFTATEIALIDVARTDYGERNVHVDAVDPTRPDIVYAHTVRRTTDMMNERLLRSSDGGRTFTEVASMPEITGVAVSEDGQRVWAGSWYGGFVRSNDRGLTFDTLDATLRVRCLAYRPGELWVCTDDVAGPFALGRSTDDGATIVPLWTFADSVDDVGCPACTQVGDVCPAYWPDVQFDLGLTTADAMPIDPDASASACTDAGTLDADMDGGVRDAGPAAPPSSRCGCRATRARAMPSAGWIVLLVVFARRRRARAI